MKLIKLSLNEFKHFKEFESVFDGKNCDVRGANGSGKTTLFDAMTWLLFGKDSAGRSKATVRRLVDGVATQNAVTSVEATLQIGGDYVTIRHEVKENWVKKSGSTSPKFEGYTHNYFIDGVPKKESDYRTYLNGICTEDKWNLLTSPFWFNNQMHWTDRRKLLLSMASQSSEEDILARHPELSKLASAIGKKTVADFRAMKAAEAKALKQLLVELPSRIDEVQRLVDTKPTPAPDVCAIDKQIVEIERRIASETADTSRRDLEVQLKALEVERSRMITDWDSAHALELSKARTAVAKIQCDIDICDRKAGDLDRRNNELLHKLSGAEELLQSLREEYSEIWQEVQPEPSVDDVCPACGQPLPEEAIDAAREEWVARWNEKKASRLESNKNQGAEATATRESLRHQIDANLNERTATMQSIAKLKQALAEAQEHVDSVSKRTFADSPSGQYVELVNQIDALRAKIDGIHETESADISKHQAELADLRQKRADASRAIATVQAHADAVKRHAELSAQFKKAATDSEEAAHYLYLCDEFTRIQCGMIEESVNTMFKIAKFRLFETQINGGINEVCDVVVNGVPYPDLNTAMQINVGLDIINVIGAHLGFTPPIFVDHAESVTHPLTTVAQQIRLTVDDSHKSLAIL